MNRNSITLPQQLPKSLLALTISSILLTTPAIAQQSNVEKELGSIDNKIFKFISP